MNTRDVAGPLGVLCACRMPHVRIFYALGASDIRRRSVHAAVGCAQEKENGMRSLLKQIEGFHKVCHSEDSLYSMKLITH